ncbi:MAG: helix-turn-helix domain-containing protein, partial [Acidobacteriota bacterium]
MIHEHDADRPYALLDRAAADTLRNIRRDIARVPEPVTRVLKRIHRHLFRADFDAADARRTEPDGSVLPAVEMQFRAQLGVPIAIYLREQRLAIALRLMYTSSLPLDQIAVLVGYSSRRAFSQAFRQAHDCTPSAHRRRALPEMVFSAPEDDLLLDLRTWRRILTGQAHAQDVGRLIDRLHRLYPTLRDVELDEPLGLGTADEQAKVAWPLLHQLDNDARRRLVTRGLRLENTALVDSLLRQSWRRAWHDLDDAAETARLALLTTRALQPTLPRDVRIEACARGHLHLAHAHRSMGGHDRAALHLAVADRLIDGLAHAERSAAPLLQAAVHAALALDRQRYRAAIERLDPIIAFLQLETPPVAAPPSPRRPSSFELPPQSAPHPVWDPALRPLAIAWRFDQRVSRTDLDADAVEARNGVCDLGLAAYLLQLRGRAAYHLGHARQAVIWLERARGYSGRAVDAPRLDLAIGCDLARACIARG